MWKYGLLIFIGMIISAPAIAQEKVCTQMGCTNGLILRAGPDMFNEEGQYEFQFFAGLNNQIRVTCRGELPLKPCDQGPSMTCSSKGVMITESGCALPEDQHYFGDIYLYGTPRKVIMAVKRNGKTHIVRTIRPTYVFTRPNGPGCEPECVTSSVDLSEKGRKD